jgi:hypothetical protein
MGSRVGDRRRPVPREPLVGGGGRGSKSGARTIMRRKMGVGLRPVTLFRPPYKARPTKRDLIQYYSTVI